jgi:hypothetical protein
MLKELSHEGFRTSGAQSSDMSNFMIVKLPELLE